MTGKSVESDLREGKRTVLTALAEGAATFDDAVEAFRRGDSDAEAVRTVLQGLDAPNHAVSLAETLVAEALGQAELLDLPEALFLELTTICDHVLSRRS